MAIELEVNLKDGVSKEAKKASMSTDALVKSMQRLQKSIAKVNEKNKISDQAFLGNSSKQIKERNKIANAERKKTEEFQKSLKATKDADAASRMSTVSASASKAAIAAAAFAYGALAAGFLLATKAAYDFATSQRVLEARLNAMGRGTSGRAFLGMLDDLSSRLPHTREELGRWAEPMIKAGVTDIPRLTQALKAAAAAEAMFAGDGAKIIDLVKSIDRSAKTMTGIGDMGTQARSLGFDVRDVAKQFGYLTKSEIGAERVLNAIGSTGGSRMVKLGNIIQDMTIKRGIPAMREMGATWDVVSKKFVENAKRLFVGVSETQGFKAFALALQRVVVLMGGVSKEGKNVDAGLSGIFGTIFGLAARAIEKFVTMSLSLQLSFLEIRVALLPLEVAIRKFIKSIGGLVDFEIALKGVAALLAVVAVLVLGVMTPFIALGAVVVSVAALIAMAAGKAVEGVQAIWRAIKGEKFEKAGEGMIAGIRDGIVKSRPLVGDAMSSTASLAEKSFNSKLEIRSPSRVLEKSGVNATRGFVRGVGKGSSDAENSMNVLAKTSVEGAASAMPKASGPGGGLTIQVNEGAVVIRGAGAPQETLKLLEEALVSLMERAALSQGVRR